MSSLFFLLGLVLIIEGNRIKDSISNQDKQLTALLDDNPKYNNSILRKSILEKYQPIDASERMKRQTIKDISKLLSAKSQLKVLLLNDKKIESDISTHTQTVTAQVKEHANVKKFKTSVVGLDVKVEKRL